MLWFFALTLALGWVMAPATDAVIGSVPAAKSGVASATNTVARMVSGALGVAVIGSIVSSLYSNDVDGSLTWPPAWAAERGPRTPSARPAWSRRISPPQAGSALLATTGDAYTQAMGNGLLVGAALTAAAAVIVARFLPGERAVDAGRARPPVTPRLGRSRSASDGRTVSS